MLRLRYDEQGIAKTHVLKQGLTSSGRLPTSDLVLYDPSVSRQHATFRVVGSECYVKDAGSRFGTFVNGEMVKDETLIAPGATVKLGEVALVLEQYVSEADLLSEEHQVSEGPGTILRPVMAAEVPSSGGSDNHLVRLLSDVNRTLLTSQSLTEVLNRVVDMAFAAVPADRAFLMLRESADEGLTARVLRHRDGSAPPNPTLSRMVVRRVMKERVAILAIDATTDPGLVTESILRFNIRSFMCAPLWSREDVIGVLYVDSPKSAQFKSGDLDAFTALTNAAAVAIEQARLSQQLLEETRRRERLQRYHSPAVVSRIIHGAEGDSGPAAQERDVTVMFCDLVGFTTLCQQIPAAQSAALLNAFLTRMTDVVFEHDGTLDKFLGDALLAVFGAPFDQPDHPLKAVRAALGMRRALADMNSKQDQKLNMRIAINSGLAITGDIGSPKRREFTVLGDVVNTAARIESEVAAPGDIVISGDTFNRIRDKVMVRALGAKLLRGRAAPLEMYAVER